MSAVATAIVGGAVIGGYMTSQAQSDAADTAANAQTASTNASIAEQRYQFNKLQDLLRPYSQAGTGSQGNAQVVNNLFNQYLGRNADPAALDFYSNRIGTAGLQQVINEISSSPEAQQAVLSGRVQPRVGSLQAQQDLLGLNGNKAQASAIAGIENSSQFNELAKQGENAMLQNASATGGLRGGNIQGALAQFRPQLLNQLINEQFTKLGGLTSIGQNAAAGTGNAGMQSANNISQLLQQQGASQAGLALAQGQAQANMWNTVGGAIGTAAGAWGGFGNTTAPSTASTVPGYGGSGLGNGISGSMF